MNSYLGNIIFTNLSPILKYPFSSPDKSIFGAVLGFKGKFKSLSYKDEFIPHGKVDLLYSEYGLDSVAIKNTVITMIK